jgi:4'-phosphopantetheinyl transferase EntD
MLGELLPACVSAVEAFEDPADTFLFPEEEAVVKAAVDKRRREFSTVRACARTALARLGSPPVPLLPGDRGAPQWPDGFVGSMTHCAGYRGAAVAHARDLAAIGIDAEPHDRLPDGVLTVICSPDERSAFATLDSGMHWDRLLFCAKEAVYKAWYPVTRRWLGFEEVRVTFAADGTFSAAVLVPGPVDQYAGRWLVRDGLALTAIAVAA